MAQETKNRRTEMTKMLLKSSLTELMKEKPIRSITIKEICERADVNRSTFYRHYATQYELYDDIFEGIINDIIAIIGSKATPEITTMSLLTDILQYAEDHRELMLVILSDNGNLNIGQAFSELITSVMKKKRHTSGRISEMEMYVVQFISAGMVNIVWLWLNAEKRQSAAAVAGVVNSLVMNGLQRAISIAGEY